MLQVINSRIILFNHSTKPLYPGDDTWVVRSKNAKLRNVDVETEYNEDGKKKSIHLEKRWVMDIWNPHRYQLIIFSFFSPPQLAIMFGLRSNNFPFVIPTAYFAALLVAI